MFRKAIITIIIIISPMILKCNQKPNFSIIGSFGTEYTYNKNFHKFLMSPYFYSGNVGIEFPPFKFLRVHAIFNGAYYSNKPVLAKFAQNEDGEFYLVDRYYDDKGRYIFWKSLCEFGFKYNQNIKKLFSIKIGAGFIPIFSIVSETKEDGKRRSGYDFKRNGYLGISYMVEIERKLNNRMNIFMCTKYTDITDDYINMWNNYDCLTINVGIGYTIMINNF